MVETGFETSQKVLSEELGVHHTPVKFVPKIIMVNQMKQNKNKKLKLRVCCFDNHEGIQAESQIVLDNPVETDF